VKDIPILVCNAGSLRGQRIEVPEGSLEVGRAEENGVVLIDEGVSRFHARFLFDNGQLWLQDAGSRNGVFVNGVRVIDHRALKVGDEVSICGCVFVVEWQDDEAAAETATPAEEPAKAGAPGKSWWWPFS